MVLLPHRALHFIRLHHPILRCNAIIPSPFSFLPIYFHCTYSLTSLDFCALALAISPSLSAHFRFSYVPSGDPLINQLDYYLTSTSSFLNLLSSYHNQHEQSQLGTPLIFHFSTLIPKFQMATREKYTPICYFASQLYDLQSPWDCQQQSTYLFSVVCLSGCWQIQYLVGARFKRVDNSQIPITLSIAALRANRRARLEML